MLDSLTSREVNEIADAPPGVVEAAIAGAGPSGTGTSVSTGSSGADESTAAARKPPTMSIASVDRGARTVEIKSSAESTEEAEIKKIEKELREIAKELQR